MKRHIAVLAIFCADCQETIAERIAYYLDIVCQIYTDVHASETGQSEKEGSIYEQILAKLPEFEQDNYQYIAAMDPDQRYPTDKKLAELDGYPDSECPVIEEYIWSGQVFCDNPVKPLPLVFRSLSLRSH